MAIFDLGRTERATKAAGKLLEKALKEELELQGHVGTGALLNSIKSKVEKEEGFPQIVVDALDYALDLNAKRHPNPTTNVSVIYDWLKTKKIGLDSSTLDGLGNLIRISIAIASTIAKEGSPTKGSKRFSKAPDKRRTGFIDLTVEAKVNTITNIIEDALGKDYLAHMEKEIKKK